MSYLPSTEGALSAFATNFSTLISASPGTYGLMASDATAISTQVNLFNAAYTLVANPATKTKATVADKNGKKAAMVQMIRQYAQTIKRNLGVSDAAKVALGLTIDDTTRTPVPVPTAVPLLNLSNIGPMRQTLRIADVADPLRRAKPVGVQGMILLLAVGTTPPTTPDLLPTKKLVTKATAELVYGSGDIGKNAYVYGAFYNPAGELGPLSAVATLPISA